MDRRARMHRSGYTAHSFGADSAFAPELPRLKHLDDGASASLTGGMTYALSPQIHRRVPSMLLSISPDVARVQPAAWAQDRPLPSQRPPDTPTQIPSEDMIEMLYLQYLAQRALQELFENGALQALES